MTTKLKQWATTSKPAFLLFSFLRSRLVVTVAHGIFRDTRIIKVALAEQTDRLNFQAKVTLLCPKETI